MTNAERTALTNLYRAWLQSDADDWTPCVLCWREAEADPQLEAMLTRINQEIVTIHHERN